MPKFPNRVSPPELLALEQPLTLSKMVVENAVEASSLDEFRRRWRGVYRHLLEHEGENQRLVEGALCSVIATSCSDDMKRRAGCLVHEVSDALGDLASVVRTILQVPPEEYWADYVEKFGLERIWRLRDELCAMSRAIDVDIRMVQHEGATPRDHAVPHGDALRAAEPSPPAGNFNYDRVGPSQRRTVDLILDRLGLGSDEVRGSDWFSKYDIHNVHKIRGVMPEGPEDNRSYRVADVVAKRSTELLDWLKQNDGTPAASDEAIRGNLRNLRKRPA